MRPCARFAGRPTRATLRSTFAWRRPGRHATSTRRSNLSTGSARPTCAWRRAPHCSSPQSRDPQQIADALKDRLGLWLVNTPDFDVAGKMWNAYGPIAGSNQEEELAGLLRLNPNVPVLSDVPYENQDQEYLDAVALDQILKRAAAR